MTHFLTKTFFTTVTLAAMTTYAFAQEAAPWELKSDMGYAYDKDGKTWVKSQDRVNAEPTPEEKAESEKIVAEHKDEINAQLAEQGQGNNAEGTAPAAGESADSARGMSAETGSNSVAQALAALAVAAMVAAGAFAARRKFFA